MDKLDFKDQFKRIVSEGLPGRESHLEVVPSSRLITADELKASGKFRQSAVGILLFEKMNSIHTVLIQRPQYEGIHSNQIAFPGGKMDLSDPDLEYTARRECFEEIQLPLGHGELLTKLTSIYIPVSGFKVKPFVFFLDKVPNFVPDPVEVESIFTFDIFELLNDANIQRMNIPLSNGLKQKNVPYFSIEDKIIWGATAMMLAELKALLKKY